MSDGMYGDDHRDELRRAKSEASSTLNDGFTREKLREELQTRLQEKLMDKVTSKQEALNRVTEDMRVKMQVLIEDVEKALQKYDGNQVSVSTAAPPIILERVAELYRKHGWKVDYGNDRDGSWFCLG